MKAVILSGGQGTRAAHAAFGWAPRVSRDDGLRRMVEWVKGLKAPRVPW